MRERVSALQRPLEAFAGLFFAWCCIVRPGSGSTVQGLNSFDGDFAESLFFSAVRLRYSGGFVMKCMKSGLNHCIR